ncbi:MAG: hypothetical protein JO019_04435 [Candidatus Kaiserbacteria bacterium]|nr:hypothetical protein [Candidatus Kaiserbacteria bacterium]
MNKKIVSFSIGLALFAAPLVASADDASILAQIQALLAQIQQLQQLLVQLQQAKNQTAFPSGFPGLTFSASPVTESTFNFNFNPGQWTSYGYQIDFGDGTTMWLCGVQGCTSPDMSAQYGGQTTHGYSKSGLYTVTLYAITGGSQKTVAATVSVRAGTNQVSNDTNYVTITQPAGGTSYQQDQYVPVTVSGTVSRQAYGEINVLHKVNGSWSAPLPSSWPITTPNNYFGPGPFSISVPNVVFSSNTSLSWPTPPGDWALQAKIYTYGCGGSDCNPPTDRTLATSDIVPITITSASQYPSNASITLSSPTSVTYSQGQVIPFSWQVQNAPAHSQVELEVQRYDENNPSGAAFEVWRWQSAELPVGGSNGTHFSNSWDAGVANYPTSQAQFSPGAYRVFAFVVQCNPQGCNYPRLAQPQVNSQQYAALDSGFVSFKVAGQPACAKPHITMPTAGYSLALSINQQAGQIFSADQTVKYSLDGPSWTSMATDRVYMTAPSTPGTYRFTVTAINSCGASDSITVPVIVSGPTVSAAPTCSVWQDHMSYTYGDPITLTWTSQNATYAVWASDYSGKDHLNLPGDKLGTSGSQVVTATVLGNPPINMVVYGPGGTGWCSVTPFIVGSASDPNKNFASAVLGLQFALHILDGILH